jgi:hypothetical protein
VDKDGGLLDGLHERGHDRIFHKHRQGAAYSQVVCGNGNAGGGTADDHLAQSLSHVLREGGKEGGREEKREGGRERGSSDICLLPHILSIPF